MMIFNKRTYLVLLLPLLISQHVKAAESNTNSIIRSTNSVDVQICVQTAFLTPQRDLFLQALIDYLTVSILNNNALYLDRQYTTMEGSLCYLFVYQAPGPDNAVNVMERLTEQPTLKIPFSSTTIQCSVQAAQWSGDDLSYLGAPFPGLWTVNDLILWGSCFLSIIFLCMSGMCCYAYILLQRQSQPTTLSNTTKPINNTPSVKLGGNGKGLHSSNGGNTNILKLPENIKAKNSA